jgi:hypothetical protein
VPIPGPAAYQRRKDVQIARLTISLVVLSVLGLSSTNTRAQNWPSFRGVNASGVAEGTNPPVTWDVEKSQNVLWKTTIPGLSHSSPIVWGNNVYVITAISSDANAGFQAKARGIGLATDDARDVRVSSRRRQRHLAQVRRREERVSRVDLRGQNTIYALDERK